MRLSLLSLEKCSSLKCFRITRTESYLDGFLEEILLLARDVVGSHDPALLSSGDLASKHTTEGVESALVRGGHHLTDVHHQRSGGVAGLDGGTGQVVRGSLVQQLGPELEIKL